MTNVIPIRVAPGRDPTDAEKSFFQSRLQQEKAALAAATDEAAAQLRRRLIARYETVLRLYEENGAEESAEPARGRHSRRG